MSELYRHDDLKAEIIGGQRITMMSPPFSNHNFVRNSIFNIFYNYLRGNVCVPIGDNHKLVLEENDGYLIPDFFVVCDRTKIKREGVYGSPDLVVEVLSYKTETADRGVKKELYQRAGVKEYWLVEPNEKYVEVYLLKGGVLKLERVYRLLYEKDVDEDFTIVTEFGVSIFPDLKINLEDIFAYVEDWPSIRD